MALAQQHLTEALGAWGRSRGVAEVVDSVLGRGDVVTATEVDGVCWDILLRHTART